MCIQTRIQRVLEEKAALDAQIQKLEQLEIKTAPIKSLLSELLADYSDVAPEDLASIWQEILAIGQKFDLSVQPLAADELKQWEATNAENERLRDEAHDNSIFWGTVKDTNEKLEEQLGEARSEITELKGECGFLKYENDDLKTKLEQLKLELETHTQKVPGQLALEFPEIAPEPTTLQKLLETNSNFTFEELGISVAIESVIAPADDTVEEVQITVCNSTGGTRKYYESAQTFVYQHSPENLEQTALGYAQFFLQELEKEAKIKEKVGRWNADETLASNKSTPERGKDTEEPAKPETDTEFEVMGYKVQIYPQYAGENNLVGATFRFMSLVEKGANEKPKLVFSTSLLVAEIRDRNWRTCAYNLIQDYRDYRDKEAAGLEKLANPLATEEDKFIELVKLTPAVGYIKRRDNGELISAYAAFANRDTAGEKITTLAKSRAKKWKEFWHSSFESCGWKVEEPRKVKRMQSEPGAKQVFAYEVKITGKFSIGQLQKLAEEDFSLLPNEIAAKSAEPATTQSVAIYHVIANGYRLASGTEEEMRLRFEQELRTFGSKGRAINLVNVNTGEDVEAYYYDDFAFIQAQDFDEANPEYFAVHTPTKTNFRVYRSIVSGANWVNSIYPHNPLSTKEAAAVDGVRRKLKADQEVNVSPVLSTKLPANPGLIYSVRIDSLEKAKGTKEEMTLYFEEQLEKLGAPHKSVVLLRDFEVKEKFDVAEFTFTEVDDFDPDNPEYEVQHLPTQKSFKTEQVMSGDWRYDINSIFSSNTVKPTRESAAADAVRKMLATGI